MEYEMGLQQRYFEAMKYQSKKVEIRLWDEKRKQIQVGDIIYFGLEPDRIQKIKTRVTKLTRYANFQETLENIPIKYLSCQGVDKEEYLHDLNLYYPKEKVNQYGVLAIEVEKLEKSCGIIVFQEDKKGKKVLMVKHLAGHWGFPKGHMENQETEEETAIRETWEETGIHAKIVGDFRKVITYQPKENVQKEVVFFQGEVVSGKMKLPNTEIQEIKWISLEEAKQMLSHQTEKALLETFSENKKELP